MTTVVIRPEEMDPPAIPDGDPYTISTAHDGYVPFMQAIGKIRQAQLDSPYRAIPELHLNGVYGVRFPTTGLDWTGLPGLVVRSPRGGPLPGANPTVNCGGTIVAIPGSSPLSVGLDLTGTQYVDVDGLSLNLNYVPSVGAAVLLARSTSPGVVRESSSVTFRNCQVAGAGVLVYCYGAEYVTLDTCELTSSGGVGSIPTVCLTARNVHGLASAYRPLTGPPINESLSFRMLGGRVQNACSGNASAGADQHCILFDGVSLAAFRDVTFNAGEDIMRIVGDAKTRSLTFDGCRFVGQARNVVRQQTYVPPESIRFVGGEHDAREVFYKQITYQTATPGLVVDGVFPIHGQATTTYAFGAP